MGRSYDGPRGGMRKGAAILATLTDRKGFEKMVMVCYPPPPVYRIACFAPIKLSSFVVASTVPDETLSTQILEFYLKDFNGLSAFYEEW